MLKVKQCEAFSLGLPHGRFVKITNCTVSILASILTSHSLCSYPGTSTLGKGVRFRSYQTSTDHVQQGAGQGLSFIQLAFKDKLKRITSSSPGAA